MTIIARAKPVDGSAPRAWRCSHVISAALSVVGTAATVMPSAAPSALVVSTTRPPPSATSSSPVTVSSRSPAVSST